MIRYTVVKPNVDVDKDVRTTKAAKKQSLYRDSKSKPHRTVGGKGVVGRLINKHRG